MWSALLAYETTSDLTANYVNNSTFSSTLFNYVDNSTFSSTLFNYVTSSYLTSQSYVSANNSNTFNGVNNFNNSVNCNTSLCIKSTKTVTGFASGTYSANITGNITVSFGFTFFNTPVVTITLLYRGSVTPATIILFSQSTNSFSYAIYNSSSQHIETSYSISWMAIC